MNFKSFALDRWQGWLIIFIASAFISATSFYSNSTRVYAQYDRVCHNNNADPIGLENCFKPYWNNYNPNQIMIYVFSTVAAISLLMLVATAASGKIAKRSKSSST